MHKHDKEIRAWLDGKTVQARIGAGRGWFDLHSVEQVQAIPAFYANEEYRIKPESVKYRLCLCGSSGSHAVVVIHTHTAAEAVERYSPTFIRWLGDWQEAEV